MHIRTISLRNFRNFSKAGVEFGRNRNLILGANAQGKTNLLEAIHILGVGRSHRDRRDANLVKFGESLYRIEGSFEHIGVKTTIEVAWNQERKRIRINGKEARPTNLIGLVGVVVSSPDDIDLIKGSPGFRRTFLDMAISQTSKEYLSDLQDYVRAVTQRNSLLRSIAERTAERSEVEIWDRSVIEAGTKVAGARVAYLQQIQPKVDHSYAFISGTRVSAELNYEPRGYSLRDGLSIRDGLSAAFKRCKEMELVKGYTMVGPHLDDFRFLSNGRDIRQFGSEGEQRTAVLALRCAEIEVLNDRLGRYPIVLLDDVFAELDSGRSKALTALISSFDQIILTSSRHEGWGEDIHTITVENGRIANGGTA